MGHEEKDKRALEQDVDASGTRGARPEHAVCVQERGHQLMDKLMRGQLLPGCSPFIPDDNSAKILDKGAMV